MENGHETKKVVESQGKQLSSFYTHHVA